jgi:hypothetical protein
MSVARSELGAFVLGGSIYAVGGCDGASKVNSMERYCVASADSRSEVNGCELGIARDALGATVMRLEVNLFDCLMSQLLATTQHAAVA